MKNDTDEPDKNRTAFLLGIITQGLVLGILLSYALLEMWAQADNVRLFRYQNF